MRKQLLLLLFSLFAVVGFARTVTGVVTQKSDNLPIIGATVMVEGTQRGTATDFDGRYTIDVQDNDVLNFSYVGMESISLKVGSQTTINVEMAENAQVLDEVVVTAMGQTQEKKKLNFAVQSLDGDLVTAGSSTDTQVPCKERLRVYKSARQEVLLTLLLRLSSVRFLR